MLLRILFLTFVSVVFTIFYERQQRVYTKERRARQMIRRELLHNMSVRDFNQTLKRAYEKHKGDPKAFVQEVPYVCDDYDSFDMEGMCGFINGTYDIKKSMFASYLVKVLRTES